MCSEGLALPGFLGNVNGKAGVGRERSVGPPPAGFATAFVDCESNEGLPVPRLRAKPFPRSAGA